VPKVTYLVLVMIVGQGAANGALEEDRRQISALVDSFTSVVAKGGDPSPFLSPSLTGALRTAETDIARKRFTSLKISGFLLDRDLVFQDAQHATLKAWVQWETPRLSEETEATIHFEKIASTWYLKDFDFLKFNWTITVLMLSLGVLYAVAVLTFYYHWRKQKFGRTMYKYAWGALLFTPIGWILYPWLKPWQDAGDSI
jgi:hypothetical protein